MFVLVTSNKLDHASQQHWTPLERDWTLITDAAAPAQELAAFTLRGDVKVQTVTV